MTTSPTFIVVGVTGALGPQPLRAPPSAGALYPLELYVAAQRVEALEPALFHFDPLRVVLERIRPLAGGELASLTPYDELLVPSAALRFVPPPELLATAPPLPTEADAARRLVWVQDGGSAPRPVPVRTGVSDGRSTEILEGELAPGDLVVVGTLGGDEGEDARPAFGRFL